MRGMQWVRWQRQDFAFNLTGLGEQRTIAVGGALAGTHTSCALCSALHTAVVNTALTLSIFRRGETIDMIDLEVEQDCGDPDAGGPIPSGHGARSGLGRCVRKTPTNADGC